MPSLETLPAELKLVVLNNLNEMKCLRSLVLASPSFHQIYLANRERVLTRTTFRELQSRSINLPSLIAVSEIGFKDDEPPPEELASAMKSIYDYFHEEEISKPKPKEDSSKRGLVLSVAQCLALLTIQELLAWEFRLDPWSLGEDYPKAAGPHGVSTTKRGFRLRCASVPIYETEQVEPWNTGLAGLPGCARRFSVIGEDIGKMIPY